jgi:ubiquinone/menaquinone biosynthesis C-methylase UbiE
MSETFHWGSDIVDIEAKDLPGLKASYLVRNAPRAGTLVELGSGGGKMLRTVKQHIPGLTLHGCDIRAAAASEAFEFRMLSAESARLPYDDAMFDAVAIMDVLEHVPTPDATLDEVVRILKPGGKLIGFVPVEGEAISAYSVFRAALGKDVYARTKEHIQAFSHASLDRLIGDRLNLVERKYAYHALGHVMDASLYAATSLPAIGKFFWSENAYYNTNTSPSLVSHAMNAALRFANRLAWTESTLLESVRFTSAGALLCAEKRG